MPGLGKIPKIGRLGLRDLPQQRRIRPLVEARGRENLTDETLPDDLRKVSREIGSGKARRVHKLREQGITGSIPELLVYDWLTSHKIDFDMQVNLPQAHTRLDFLIHPRNIAIRVQGEYWHHEDDPRDKAIRYALELMKFTVVDVFGEQLYRNMDQVMSMAVAGREIPR